MKRGSHMTEETRARMSAAKIGNTYCLGTHWSEEAKRRHKGRIPWNKGTKGQQVFARPKVKPCQNCGKEYQPTVGTQKYCPDCAPGMLKVSRMKYRLANREKMKIYSAERYKANILAVKAYNAKRYIADPEKMKTWGANWSKRNPEKKNGYSTKYRLANPEKTKLSCAKYAKTHLEKGVLKSAKRRALKYGNTAINERLTLTQWLEIFADAHGHCHYCDKEARLTMDHVIPLSRGGKDSKDNVVAACLHCNTSKGNKTLEEWNKARQKAVIVEAAIVSMAAMGG